MRINENVHNMYNIAIRASEISFPSEGEFRTHMCAWGVLHKWTTKWLLVENVKITPEQDFRVTRFSKQVDGKHLLMSADLKLREQERRTFLKYCMDYFIHSTIYIFFYLIFKHRLKRSPWESDQPFGGGRLKARIRFNPTVTGHAQCEENGRMIGDVAASPLQCPLFYGWGIIKRGKGISILHVMCLVCFLIK